MIILILFTLIILTAVWNGLVIKWGLQPDKTKVVKISKVWHGLGLAIRLILVLLLFLLTKSFLMAAVAALISWIPYNMIINKINGFSLFYIGRTSTIDKFIRKIFNLK